MLLRLDVEDRDGLALITAIGEIDASTADSLSTAVADALADGHSYVVVDFAQVGFIDSTGLGVLVKSHRAAVAARGAFAVVHPTPQTLKLIRVLGLDQLLSIFSSHEEAFAQRS